MLRALAQEDALIVFAAVVAATGTGAAQRTANTISIAWATAAGVSRRTGLSDTAVSSALARLTEAHLIAESPEGDGWRTDFSSLRQAAAPQSD